MGRTWVIPGGTTQFSSQSTRFYTREGGPNTRGLGHIGLVVNLQPGRVTGPELDVAIGPAGISEVEVDEPSAGVQGLETPASMRRGSTASVESVDAREPS